ncbi:MAG: 3-hydroxyacyl-CoA dehydrogenase NAD-binding domain-containing protein [Woeseiaceae bacterium]|nr:3-hydroxyacyl-CoA dehydrogenase NAD-binding domain-containing protein [Woeseiaceae bacterium]
MTNSETTATNWTLETDNNSVAWLCIDKADSSANVLSASVLHELDDLLTGFERQPPTGVVIHSGKSNGFIMGADINEFTSIQTADEGFKLIRLGQQLFDRLEALRCPTVAVINGFCLGGGFELAMACTYRIALETDKAVIGLPEVQLGLHPGFGGTIRSVQIAGVRNAMQLMLTGKPIRVAKAKSQGLIDRIVAADDWRPAAERQLKSGSSKASAPFMDKLLNLGLLRSIIVRVLTKQVSRKARRDHYPSPYAMIDMWRRYGARGKAAFEAEARSFAEIMVGSTSRNLVRVFFLQNRLKAQGNKPKEKVTHVHVVGAGVMGGDIAAWCALRGLNVTLQDREEKYITPALERATKLFGKRVRDPLKRAEVEKRLTADVPGDGVAGADLIIEAIYENLEAKQSLYEDLQTKMKPGAILATNTSSIRLEDLRTVLNDPDRFIGIHFFNPVAQLPLVEIIRCADTQQAVLDSAFGFVKGIGKFPLECASSPGFVVNRILGPYMAEAMHLAEAGVPLTTIDAAAEDFGMPMGPIELIDSVGLDVALHVSKVLGSAFDRVVPDTLATMVENKHLGRKEGQGFYEWIDGKVAKPARDRQAKPAEIIDRLILPMINEAVACLHEGVVTEADLLDAGVIFGTGFAPFRGGPLQYARDRGITNVTETLTQLASEFGARFQPHEGWDALDS